MSRVRQWSPDAACEPVGREHVLLGRQGGDARLRVPHVQIPFPPRHGPHRPARQRSQLLRQGSGALSRQEERKDDGLRHRSVQSGQKA